MRVVFKACDFKLLCTLRGTKEGMIWAGVEAAVSSRRNRGSFSVGSFQCYVGLWGLSRIKRQASAAALKEKAAHSSYPKALRAVEGRAEEWRSG